MEKKKLIAILFVLAVIIIIVILLLQRCEPRVKPAEEPATETGAITETGSGSTAEEIDLEKYRGPFIAANIEFTCMIVEKSELKNDENTFKTLLNETFKKHTLPIEDDPLMVAILNKYENDQSVIEEIKAGAKNCQSAETSTK